MPDSSKCAAADEPELTFGEQGSRLGDIWKQMTEVEKAEFVDLNIKDQARVKQELKDLGIEKPAPKPRAPRAKKAPSKVRPPNQRPPNYNLRQVLK